MKKITESRWDPHNKTRCPVMGRISLWLAALTMTGVNSVWAGQAITGKIVIDGVVIGGSNTSVIKGIGVMGREKRQADEFHSIILKGGADIHYQRGQKAYIEVTGDQNLLPLIETQNRAGILTIGSTESYQPQLPLIVEISGPHLKEVIIEGASEGVFKDLDEDVLKIEINGSGSVHAEGKTNRFYMSLNGAGDVDAKNLYSEQADIQIMGSGNIHLTVDKSINAAIMGSGKVLYYGHPEHIKKRILGSGEVIPGD